MAAAGTTILQPKHMTRVPGFGCGAFGPLFVSVWDSDPTEERARVAGAAMLELAKSQDKMLVLSVLGPSVPPPESNVRREVAGFFDKVAPNIVTVANVIEGEGFRAAAMRGVLIGIGMVIRPNRPEKVCGSVYEASQFLASHSEGRIVAEQIVAAVARLRASA